MDITVEKLKENYRLIDTMEHDNFMPFITPYLNKRNVATVFFVTACAFFLILAVFLVTQTLLAEKSAACLKYLVFGVMFTYGLIPLHEYIHALAYKAKGARDVSYDMNLKSFIFLTVADQFVADKKEFTVIALAPFTVITTLLGTAFFFSGGYWPVFISGMLFLHTFLCIGDFGMVSYFISHKGRAVVTYDNKKLKQTYFYEVIV